MKCMKKYADGGAWPPGNKMDKSCKGPKAWHGGGENSPGTSRSGQRAGMLSSKPTFDSSRMVSQRELERRRKKKETAGMGVAEKVRYNMDKRKNQKATKEATQLNRYAGPRFL